MQTKTCPATNRIEVDVVKDGRYEGTVFWLKLEGARAGGGLFPLSHEAAKALAEALDAALNVTASPPLS